MKLLRQLSKDRLALLGLCIVGINLLVALGGAWIRPDATPYANNQALELSLHHPGTEITQLKVRRNDEVTPPSFLQRWLVGANSTYRDLPVASANIVDDHIRIQRYTTSGDGATMDYLLADVIYPLKGYQRNGNEMVLTLSDGTEVNTTLDQLQQEVMADHLVHRTYWLGTDKYGRDVLSRLMSGSLISFSVGVISVLISLLIGITMGMLAGYFKGWADKIVTWFINVVWSIPTLLMVIAITMALGKGYWQVFIAVGLTMWVEVARVVRGQVLSIAEKEYVEAARALGYGHFRIVTKHILPNITAPLIVISAANFATAILIEAGLSFLGIGAAPPQATWGKMISEHKGYIITGDAYLAIIPGVAIMLLVLSLVLIGNGLRDVLDVRNSENN